MTTAELKRGRKEWLAAKGIPDEMGPCACCDHDVTGDLTIFEASALGKIGVLKQHVKNGMDVNALGLHDRTALFHASMAGHCCVVLYLLREGADTELADDTGVTPLWIATVRATQGRLKTRWRK